MKLQFHAASSANELTYWGLVVNEFNLLHASGGQLFH